MRLPKHIAIIMDGNGRWAQLRGKPRTYGHIKGARVAKKIVTSAAQKGLENLTLYAFSSENWLRPATEVSFLMNLLRRYLRKETASLVKQNIRFQAIGEISRLPDDLRKAISYTAEATSRNTGMNLIFAISYGSRQEIKEAVQKIAERVQNGKMTYDDITEDTIQGALSTSKFPDPDLIIRTSGEHRLSNFLLWQAAYSEFYFCDTLWPEFTSSDFDFAIHNFAQRERRFGAVFHHENAHH